MPLSETEIAQITELLKRLSPAEDVPLAIFYEFARLQCLPVLELVPLRLRENQIEVLMFKRPPDDPFFANEWHTPGTIIRARDGKLSATMQRLIDHELPGVKFTGHPQLVMEQLHKSKRGSESATVFYRLVADPGGLGEWFPADNLPPNTIESQLEFIHAAAEQCKQDQLYGV